MILFIANKIAFFVLLLLFLLVGLMLANRTVREKEKHKKEHHSVILCWPFGFLTGFFLTDPRLSMVFEGNRFETPLAFVVHWFVIFIVGIVISFIASFFMIKKVQAKIKFHD